MVHPGDCAKQCNGRNFLGALPFAGHFQRKFLHIGLLDEYFALIP
jgi:hypothetical protein